MNFYAPHTARIYKKASHLKVTVFMQMMLYIQYNRVLREYRASVENRDKKDQGKWESETFFLEEETEQLPRLRGC